MWPFKPSVVSRKLDRVLRQNETIIMLLEDLVTALDAETNAVAARLDKLQADLAAALAAGQAPKPETLAALQAVSDRLKSLGQDPANPVPAPTP
jgi:hypothetical protein